MHRPKRNSERGMTLIEALVAILVFTVIFMAALALYQSANKAYLSTDAATIQQQNVRFAMDRVVGTLRDAGANYNPLGTSSLADEQIEGAWQSAIIVRGDFDNAEESGLRSTALPIVSTGNDEIVAYVLRKPTAEQNPYTISLKADLRPSTGRDASVTYSSTGAATIANEETVNIAVAARTLAEQTNPPYQLVKVTFTPTGAPQYEVVADNIFRMSFDYLDASGTALIQAGSNDGSADAQRAIRANVRRLAINLIGMADRPELGYSDPVTYTPAEGAGTKAYRKFALSERVMTVNLGLKGRSHNLVPALNLNPPEWVGVCTGHARNFHVSWPASTSPGITRYRVHVTAPSSATPPAGAIDSFIDIAGLSLDYEQPDGVARNFTFSVAPLSNIGLEGIYSASVAKTMSHDTVNSKANAPTNVIVTPVTGENALEVTWNPPSQNIGAVTGSTRCARSDGGSISPEPPWSLSAVDLTTFRVHRLRAGASGASGTFTPAASTRIDNQTVGAGATALTNVPTEPPPFIDRTAAPCTSYYYRVLANDWDNIESDPSAALAAPVSYTPATSITPAAPASLGAQGSPTVAGGRYLLTLDWPDVTQTDATPAQTVPVAKYTVERYRRLEGANPYDFTYETSFDVWDASQYTDNPLAAVTVSGTTLEADYRYYVRAKYECSPEIQSAQSEAYTLACAPTGTVTINSPSTGSTVSRPYEITVPIRLTVTGANWTRARVRINGTSYDQTLDAPTSPGVYEFAAWDTSGLPDGTYTITAYAMQGACRADAINLTIVVETTNCGLELVTNLAGSNPQYRTNTNRELQFKIRNTCPADIPIQVSGFSSVSWVGGPNALTARMTQFRVGNTILADNLLLASGSGANFTTSVTIPGNSIYPAGNNNFFGIVFSQTMRNNALGGTTYRSIRARVVSPASNDELVPAGGITP